MSNKPLSQASLVEQLHSLKGNTAVFFHNNSDAFRKIVIQPLDQDRSLQLGFSLIKTKEEFTVEQFRNELMRAIVDRHSKTWSCEKMDLTEPLVFALDRNVFIERLNLFENIAGRQALRVLTSRSNVQLLENPSILLTKNETEIERDAQWLAGFYKWRNLKQN